jgi:hypothetical protein
MIFIALDPRLEWIETAVHLSSPTQIYTLSRNYQSLIGFHLRNCYVPRVGKAIYVY